MKLTQRLMGDLFGDDFWANDDIGSELCALNVFRVYNSTVAYSIEHTNGVTKKYAGIVTVSAVGPRQFTLGLTLFGEEVGERQHVGSALTHEDIFGGSDKKTAYQIDQRVAAELSFLVSLAAHRIEIDSDRKATE